MSQRSNITLERNLIRKFDRCQLTKHYNNFSKQNIISKYLLFKSSLLHSNIVWYCLVVRPDDQILVVVIISITLVSIVCLFMILAIFHHDFQKTSLLMKHYFIVTQFVIWMAIPRKYSKHEQPWHLYQKLTLTTY